MRGIVVSPSVSRVKSIKMFVLLLPFCFFSAEAFSILPLSSLKECPTIPPQDNLQIEQLTGTWRLAYLFYDGHEDFEEDDSCIVTEFTRLGDTKMNIGVYMDKKDDLFIDRSAINLLATFSSPGEWLLHSNISREAFLHVTVISSTRHRVILTFCISNMVYTEKEDETSKFGNYHGFYDSRHFQDGKHLLNFAKLDPGAENNNGKGEIFGRRSYFRVKRNLLRSENLTEDEKMELFQNELTKNNFAAAGKYKKHFWTVILVKDNNNSALNFVENASLLMKFGFDLTQGNLVSFGRCND